MAEVRLIEYQHAWASQYLGLASELGPLVAGRGHALEHIGSTAVPGLCAKPVLDVLLGVGTLADAEAMVPGLAALGFAYRPEYEASIPERRYFVRPEARTLRVHLHAVVQGGRLWLQHLRFRDALRHDPALRQAYAALKQQLAIKHATDKAAYTEAKASFIVQVFARQSQSVAVEE